MLIPGLARFLLSYITLLWSYSQGGGKMRIDAKDISVIVQGPVVKKKRQSA